MTAKSAPHIQTKHVPTLAVLAAVELSWASYHERAARHVSTGEVLMHWFGCSEKVAWNAVSREVDRGTLEHGVSLRSSYLNDDGKRILKAARNAMKRS